eukprot:jgi/Chlat1/2465/Chrsp171S02345
MASGGGAAAAIARQPTATATSTPPAPETTRVLPATTTTFIVNGGTKSSGGRMKPGSGRGGGRALLRLVTLLVAGAAAIVQYASRMPPPVTEAAIRDAGAVPVRLPDGRLLEVYEAGVKDGVPLLYFHGMSGTGRRFTSPDYQELFEKLKIRAILPSLPGHGLSDVVLDRKLKDWPSDMADVLTTLGLEDAKMWSPQPPGEEKIDGLSEGPVFALLKKISASFIPRTILSWIYVDVWGPEALGFFLPRQFGDFFDPKKQPHIPHWDLIYKDLLRSYNYTGPRGWAEVPAMVNAGYGFDWRSMLGGEHNNISRPPVQVACATGDEMSPVRVCEHFVAGLPRNGRLRLVKGTHVWTMQEIEAAFWELLQLGVEANRVDGPTHS